MWQRRREPRRRKRWAKLFHRDPRLIEGFIAVSAKVPYNQNLIVFPAHLGAGSSVDYAWQDASGSHTYRVDQNNPGGYYP
jgi:hypothetical protein